MSISAEEKVCYLREAAIVLAKEGFQLDEVHTDRLCILLDGAPLCEVTESGGIAYRNKDIDEPERIAAKEELTAEGVTFVDVDNAAFTEHFSGYAEANFPDLADWCNQIRALAPNA